MIMMKPPAYTKIQNPLLNPPSYIVYNDVRFLIIDTPCISNMSRYIKVSLSFFFLCSSFVTNDLQ